MERLDNGIPTGQRNETLGYGGYAVEREESYALGVLSLNIKDMKEWTELTYKHTHIWECIL